MPALAFPVPARLGDALARVGAVHEGAQRGLGMARRERARSFLFEPGRFINDDAVRLMDPEALGGYAAIFCQLWEQPDPGMVPDSDRLLASLARMAPETWTRARSQIAGAFDTTSRPGFWLQRGMIQTAKAQDEFVARQSRYGKAAAKSRWDKPEDAPRIANALPTALESECAPHARPVTPSVLGSRFSVESTEESKAERPRARRAPPRKIVRDCTPEQIQAAAQRFSLDPARVQLLAEQIALLVDAGKYVSAPAALLNWCSREHPSVNGAVNPDEYTSCRICHYSPLEQARSKRSGLCGSCQSNESTRSELARIR